jgi:endonuclease/exonuclease/phosphatase family metal-dependent hydrolase
MKPERWRRIGRGSLTVSAAMSVLLWVLAAVLVARSYWRADCVVVLLENQRFELSSAWGRFYVRINASLPEKANPFGFDKDWAWGSYQDPSQIAQSMQRLSQKFEGDRWQFLGFRSARGSHRIGATVWLRYAEGPLWPTLAIFAVPPVGWLWRRRSWPHDQQRRAARALLLTSSAPVAIAVVLFALLFINFRFLGPRETPLSGRTSHPSTLLVSDANGVTLRIMTYNIRMAGAYRGGWRFEKPQRVMEHIEKIAQFVREQQPDIIFLQEVVIDSGLGSFSQAPVLAGKTGMHMWVFGQCINDGLPFHRMIEGNAILSRWPVEPLTNQKMAGHKAFYEVGYESQSTLWCKADIGGQEVLLASVHLNANDFYKVRLAQAQQLLDFAGDGLAILAGDFNSEPNEAEIRRIVDTERFAVKLDGPFTVSSYDPHAVIDYIFVPRNWQLLEHRVIQTALSDHLPVVSTYRIPLAPELHAGGQAEDRWHK